MARWLSRPSLILSAGWLVALLYGYPGRVTWDSLEMLKAVREGGTTDVHAPVLELGWRGLELVIAGPIGWFAVQVLAFSLGAFAILRRRLSPPVAAGAAVALLLFPPIIAPLAVVWRQSMMVGLLVAGTAGLLSERRAWRIAGLVAMWFACSAGDSGIVATLPIIALLFQWSPEHRRLHRYALAMGSWLGIALFAMAANYALVEQETNPDAMKLAPFDIAGVVTRIQATDAELEGALAGTGLRVHADIKKAVRKHYQPRDFISLVTGPTAPWRMPLLSGYGIDDEQADALRAARRSLLLAHPGAYATHRYAIAKEVLGLGKRPSQPLAALDVLPTEIAIARGVPTRGSETRDLLTEIVVSLSMTSLFSPWLYALLALLLIPFARRVPVALALLLSGWFSLLYAFVYATGYDIRWSQWMIAATCLAAVVLIAHRARRGEAA